MPHTDDASTWVEVSLYPRRRGRSGRVILWGLVLPLLTITVHGQDAVPLSPRELLRSDPGAFTDWLDRSRPQPPSATDRESVIGSLPERGEVKPWDRSSERKLTSLNAFLRRTGYDSAFEIKLVEAGQMRVVLHGHFVLVSAAVLRLLEAEELQALVAHEIGHKYVLVGLARQAAPAGQPRPKDLELLCDAIAIVLLRRHQMDSSLLIAAIEKITKHNWLMDLPVEERTYPSLRDRRRFARDVATWLSRARPSGVSQ